MEEKKKFSLSSIGDNPRKTRSKEEVTPGKGREGSMIKTRYKEIREKKGKKTTVLTPEPLDK